MLKISSSKFELVKFDGKVNFRLWQKRVKAILVRQGLQMALLGKEKKPESMKNEDWEELDLKALSMIHLCLTDEVMYNVLDEDSTLGLWMKLERVYMAKSLMKKFYLKKQLYNFRMEPGTSMLEHFNSFNKLIAQLLNLDVKVEEEDRALLLLLSLPDSYDHLMTTILHACKDTLEMEAVMTILLSNEMKRISSLGKSKELMEKESDWERGRSKGRGSSSQGRSKSRFRLQKDQCAFCKERGHWKKDCPKI